MAERPSEALTRARAPGRVNLIGEHTDYNDGLVLPMPIPQHTHVELRPREDGVVTLRSAEEQTDGEYTIGSERPTDTWVDYVQGITVALRKRGMAPPGFALRVSSAVPIGAGLSSSAALEVAVLRALREAFQLSIDDYTIARIGQEAEVEFVGVPTGLMDQLASSLGEQGSALFIDIRSGHSERVALPSALEPVVIASGVTHAHGTGEYRIRRAECETAARSLGVSSLRDASLELLHANATVMDATSFRRARHVITENDRVLATVAALHSEDRAALGELFAASHASMRDDYEVSVPEIDLLVDLAASERAIVGARLTGGGFGGSVVMLAERGRGLAAARAIAERYQKASGRDPSILLPEAHS